MVSRLVGDLLSTVMSNVGAVVTNLVGKGYNLWSNFDNDINFLKRELAMMAGEEEENQLTEELRDLALEIEDLLDRVMRHVVKRDQGPIHKVLGFADGLQLQDKIKELKKELKYRRSKRNGGGRQPSSVSLQHTAAANTYTSSKVRPAVGIDESKQEIWDWLMKDVEGEAEQRRVVSIVGFNGSGKSTLVKEVYDCPDVASKFPHRAWVVASKHRGDAKMILTDLFKKLGNKIDKVSDSDDVEQLQAKISDYLKKSKTKRYLIVLDDIKNQTWWDGIKCAFPEETTGRIIVTTTIQRIAKVCSRGNGYVHNMTTLDDAHSQKLLKAVLKDSPDLELSSVSIRNKCDGHPHALVTIANYLQGENPISKPVCDELCRDLGSRMASKDEFKELQWVLMNNYRSLPKVVLNLKTCFLYICVFPNGCNISRSRLIRRWCAEGYVQYDYPRSALDVGEDSFKELADQSMIWPIDTSNDANVKTFKAHSIFHEFMLHMSKSAKFITGFEDPKKRNYRHLFIQNTSRGMASNANHHRASTQPGGKSANDEEKPRAHSLTICGTAEEAVLRYLAKCELLRVLDLEECKDLDDNHLDGIHELWHLKYLSVGDSISGLPKHIEKMHCLETLDMRKTKKEIKLSVEVIKLPNLVHLLGRFKLDNKDDWDESKLEKDVPEKSNLQTLAGFVTDYEPGFQILMDGMKHLRKVKIWAVWRCSFGEDFYLERAIQNFVKADLDTGVACRSLSLYICKYSAHILRSIACGCLRTLKLHGELKGQVHFAKELYSLKELCLSSTNDLTESDLSVLRELSCFDLEYLKLVGVSLGGFIIRYEDFRALLRICLVQCPSLPTIEKGALPNLLSLRLLNQDLDGLSGIKIEWHESLQEIALDSEVKPETKSEWKNAAKNHQKRPRILYLKRVTPYVTGSMAKYVATEKPVLGDNSTTMLGKRPVDTVESNSSGEPNSTSKQTKRENSSLKQEARVPDSSPAFTEPLNAMDIDMPSSSRVIVSDAR